MRSSYIQNNYGNVFKALILAHLPSLVIECGVLDGYSTLNIAHALRHNRINRGIESTFFAYDLWENYDYKHGDFGEVATMLRENGLLNHYVNLHYGDVFEVHTNFQENSVDLLFLDISNDGDIINRIVKLWDSKIKNRGIIIAEGGSKERDKIEWMLKYNKKSIREAIITNKIITEKYKWFLFEEFPSVSLLIKHEI